METGLSENAAYSESRSLEEVLAEKERLIGELKRQLQEESKAAEQCRERLMYLRAEFDNFRKYTEREREQIVMLAEERLMRDLLVTLDDFECLLRNSRPHEDAAGLQLILRNLWKVLETHGLERIEAKGRRFDPFYHEAICREKSECEEGTVLEELQTGYMFKKKVLRPAKVKIAEPCTVMDRNTEEGE